MRNRLCQTDYFGRIPSPANGRSAPRPVPSPERLKMKMRILHFCACFCTFAVVASGFLHAQDLAATWQGTLPAGNDLHRVAIQIAKKDGGEWAVPACDVEFLHDPARVDSLVVSGSRLKLSVDGGKGNFEGQVSSDGALIEGTWTYDGHAAPLE